ncbi:sugar phosphate isomerase/epimerase family protein [Amycolatopsis sp. NPDC059657]|uniref:sugar phosphate isomerase/epimerase family protein n=1 Tax=Amycolatopsis sp. NPDC059657 TaxID=3346899 RepID=UPI003672317E
MCGDEAQQAMSRRSILRGAAATAALAAGAALALPGSATAAPGFGYRRIPLSKISIQLYTLRDALQADLPGTLSALADIGYRQVELAGTYGRTAQEFRALLDKNHIRATSTHVGIDGDLNKTIADAKILGNRYANVPFAQFSTIDEWKAFAGRLDAAALAFAAAGIELGYHNHSHEFAPIGGVRPYDVLTANTDRRYVHLEIDLFWAVNAGVNPIDVYEANFSRVMQYHVKDRTADGKMVDPGAGVINFPRIFAATSWNLREYIVEHDNPVNSLTTAKVGFDYLRDLRY